MKTLPYLCSLLLIIGSNVTLAQSVTNVAIYSAGGQTNYPVTANQVITYTAYASTWAKAYSPAFPAGIILNFTQTYTGLTNLSVSGVGTYACFQITTPPTMSVPAVTNYLPADCLVIPASATGNVQIILETSPDLLNWSAADPGLYGMSNGTNRFFRVRAQTQ